MHIKNVLYKNLHKKACFSLGLFNLFMSNTHRLRLNVT